jgi:hypothetical protein
MQHATVGRIVHAIVNPADNNGSDVAPAVITRVWGEPYEADQYGGNVQSVNVRILLDGHDTDWRTSILLCAQRPSDDVLAAANPYNPKGHNTVAFWPPREH